MEKTDNITLEEKCQSIIKNVPLDLNDDQKMRYVYHELGLIFAKDVDFFTIKKTKIEGNKFLIIIKQLKIIKLYVEMLLISTSK